MELSEQDINLLVSLHLINKQQCLIQPLIDDGYLVRFDVGDIKLKITNKGILKIRKKLQDSLPENYAEEIGILVDQFREIFPNKESGGRKMKGDKQGVLKKMKKFLKNYAFTYEEILQAARDYEKECSYKNHKYMMCADYFIEKFGSSQLAAYCEKVELNLDEPKSYLDEVVIK